MSHNSMGCIKLLNQDLLCTVNILENFRFHNVGVQRRVRESVCPILELADICVSLPMLNGYSFLAARKSLKSVTNEPDEFKYRQDYKCRQGYKRTR